MMSKKNKGNTACFFYPFPLFDGFIYYCSSAWRRGSRRSFLCILSCRVNAGRVKEAHVVILFMVYIFNEKMIMTAVTLLWTGMSGGMDHTGCQRASVLMSVKEHVSLNLL